MAYHSVDDLGKHYRAETYAIYLSLPGFSLQQLNSGCRYMLTKYKDNKEKQGWQFFGDSLSFLMKSLNDHPLLREKAFGPMGDGGLPDSLAWDAEGEEYIVEAEQDEEVPLK